MTTSTNPVRITALRIARCIILGLMQFLVPLSSYGVQPAPLDVLQRARSRLQSDVNHQVRYTCTQNIIRRFYRPDSKEPTNCTNVVAGGADGKHDVSLTSWDHVALNFPIYFYGRAVSNIQDYRIIVHSVRDFHDYGRPC
jgi:hypothetical protein